MNANVSKNYEQRCYYRQDQNHCDNEGQNNNVSNSKSVLLSRTFLYNSLNRTKLTCKINNKNGLLFSNKYFFVVTVYIMIPFNMGAVQGRCSCV